MQLLTGPLSDIVRDDVYARECFSESEGTRLGGRGHCGQWMSLLFCGVLPNPFIHNLFLWRTSQEFVKTDLYPLFFMSGMLSVRLGAGR